LGGAWLTLAGNDAEGEPFAASPPQVVKSRDGGLAVSVPQGALRKPVKVRIRVLSRAQYPPELRDATYRPGSKLYALEPAGTRFLKPVTITRRIDTKLAGFPESEGRPMIVLTTRSAGGKWEILGNQRARMQGDTVVVRATARHFSTLVSLDGSYRVSLSPSRVEKRVGEEFDAIVRITATSGRTSTNVEADYRWVATGGVERVFEGSENADTLRCESQGKGTYAVSVLVSEIDPVIGLLTFGTRGYQYEYKLAGEATCRRGPPSPVELAFACVAVSHTPLGSFPSFTRWLLQFARASLPANAQASLTVAGVNNGQAMSQPLDAGTGKVELVGGISAFGPKQVQQLTVSGQNATQQLVAKVGAAPTVTSSQGVIAGQCPP
jgi:hypothetical protein